jgi:hypothetical protein
MSIIKNIYIDKGSTFSEELKYDKPIFGYLARSQMRRSYYSNSFVELNASVIDEANGVINLSLPHGETELLRDVRYLYDVELYDGNTVIRAFEGIAVVNPEVTR